MPLQRPYRRRDKRAPSCAALRLQMRAISDLQRRLLPRELPQPPGWRLAAHYSASGWPGGDYYDVLALNDRRLAVIVADVSGHGGLAAVMVAQVHSVLHSCPLSSGRGRLPFCPLAGAVTRPPGIVLGHLDRTLEENSADDQFMTAFYGVLDLNSGVVQYANAGHPVPRRRCAAGGVEPVSAVGGPPLGVGLAAGYAQASFTLEQGDGLVLYTDGLTEACNDKGEVFGVSRLDAALRGAPSLDAGALVGDALAAWDEFLAGAPVQDDVTLIAIARAPPA